jgi:hypothetical protein
MLRISWGEKHQYPLRLARTPTGSYALHLHALQHPLYLNVQLGSAHACLPYTSSSQLWDEAPSHALQADTDALPAGEYGMAGGQLITDVGSNLDDV